jgi:iron complex outermembrane receptor protein
MTIARFQTHEPVQSTQSQRTTSPLFGYVFSVAQPSRLRVSAVSRRDGTRSPSTGTVPEFAAETAALRALNTHLIGKVLLAILWVAAATLSGTRAEEISSAPAKQESVDLLQLSFEDLGKIKVTTVSRKSENLSGAAAAIHVITQEDVRRSGVTSLAEALRMAPGLDVARAGSRQWAISARGFNHTFANKLLVLMDGRTIYTPLFSGVFWEETDTVLEDLDRIEVIRGPGATLWGANAVNGVINIITKSSKETQGTLISGGGGFEERAFGTVRYGGRLGTNAYYRVYGKYADRDEFTMADGSGASDSWWTSQGGFRLDWEPSEMNRLTLQGDYYHADLGARVNVQSLNPPKLSHAPFRLKAEGANVLGRWTHDISASSDMSLQMSYDRTDRGFGIAREIRDTFDLDAQHRFHFGRRHEIVWGAGYRYSADDITESPDFTMRDPSVGLQLVSAFVQDAIALVPDHLHVTLGTKVEQNDFTGFEVQPSGRISWIPHERHTLWGAVSRAVRTPSRAERDVGIFTDPSPVLPPLPLPLVAPGAGNSDFRSEDLIAYEIGYRVSVHPRLSLDFAVFYNEYNHLNSVVAQPLQLQFSSGPTATPYLVLPLVFGNDLHGETYGGELSALWQPVDHWRLRAAYTFLQMQLHTRGSVSSLSEANEGSSPHHQVSLWSDIDLGSHVEWGFGLRYVDRLPGLLQRIPAYTELETRLAWKPTRHCELAIVGKNLLHAHHREYSPVEVTARNVAVDRAIYAKITLRF